MPSCKTNDPASISGSLDAIGSATERLREYIRLAALQIDSLIMTNKHNNKELLDALEEVTRLRCAMKRRGEVDACAEK
jgi:hypothetical protein